MKFMIRLFVVAGLVSSVNCFVEEVQCSSNSMNVILNRNDEGLRRWMQDPNAQPVAYVYGHKPRTPCGIALKGPNGLPLYNLTVPFGLACGLILTDLEPNYQTAETTIALEDNNDANQAKPMRINHVFCLYTRRIHTMRLKDISTGHQVVASTGGKPKPKVRMIFKTKSGKPIRAAKFGDQVSFYLAIDPDNAYKAIAPRKCLFSDKETMEEVGAQKLTFVQSHCPVEELSEIISPLQDLNEEVYHTSFRTFRFGNKSTVYAHCSVEVCLEQKDCHNACFKQVSNLNSQQVKTQAGSSNQNPLGTSLISGSTLINSSGEYEIDANNLNIDPLFRNQRRFTRDVEGGRKPETVAITNALTILDDEEMEEIAFAGPQGGALESCLDNGSTRVVYLVLAILAAGLLLSMTIAICLANKLRKQTKDLETKGLACGSSTLSAYSSIPRSTGTIGHHSTTIHKVEYGQQPQPQPHHHHHHPPAGGVVTSEDDRNRSVSEMTVPQAWLDSLPSASASRHSTIVHQNPPTAVTANMTVHDSRIPRVTQNQNYFY